MSAKKMNGEIILDVGLSLLDTNVKKNTGSGINLTHNKIKDTMKVIRKQRDFIKRIYYKNYKSRKRNFKFSQTIKENGLPLMKSILTSLAKSILLP